MTNTEGNWNRFRTGLIFLNIFNLIDIFSTFIIMRAGGIETNPLMDYLIQKDFLLFVFVKIVLINIFCSYVIWKRRNHLVGKIMLSFGLGFYGLICLYYLTCLIVGLTIGV